MPIVQNHLLGSGLIADGALHYTSVLLGSGTIWQYAQSVLPGAGLIADGVLHETSVLPGTGLVTRQALAVLPGMSGPYLSSAYRDLVLLVP